MSKKSFIIFTSNYDILKKLTNEQMGVLFHKVFCYELKQDYEINDATVQMAFEFIKINLDINNEKYENIVKRNRENGALGGRPRNNPKNPLGNLETQNNPKNLKDDNKDDNKDKGDNDNKDDNKSLISSPPPISSIIAYGYELGVANKYCEDFFNYYKDNDWKNKEGKDISKTWKSVFKRWAIKDKKIKEG